MDQSLRFNVNGLNVKLPAGFDLGKNLNSVIKAETGFKVIPRLAVEYSSGAT